MKKKERTHFVGRGLSAIALMFTMMITLFATTGCTKDTVNYRTSVQPVMPSPTGAPLAVKAMTITPTIHDQYNRIQVDTLAADGVTWLPAITLPPADCNKTYYIFRTATGSYSSTVNMMLKQTGTFAQSGTALSWNYNSIPSIPAHAPLYSTIVSIDATADNFVVIINPTSIPLTVPTTFAHAPTGERWTFKRKP